MRGMGGRFKLLKFVEHFNANAKADYQSSPSSRENGLWPLFNALLVGDEYMSLP